MESFFHTWKTLRCFDWMRKQNRSLQHIQETLFLAASDMLAEKYEQ